MLKMKLRRRPTLVKAIPRLQMCGICLVTASKTIGGTHKQTGLQTTPAHHDDPIFIAPSWFSAPPGLTLPGKDWTTGGTNFCFEKVTSKDILDQGAHCQLLRNTTTWPFQNLKNTCESKKFVDPKSSSATTSMTFGTQVCAQ